MATFFANPYAVDMSTGEENQINILANSVYLTDKTTTVQSAITTLQGYFASGSANTAVKLKTSRKFSITGGATAAAIAFNGSGNVALNVTALDASKLTGTIDIARLPAGALERMVVVANDTARYALTTSEVQVGDVVKVTGTKKAWYVKDTSKLSSDAGYEEFPIGTAAAVAWANVTGKPSTFTPASHTHTPTEAGVIGTAPTSGQVAVFDGTTGKIKSTGYTIAKSVPSSAVFTDANVKHTLNNTAKAYVTGTTGSATNTGGDVFDTGVYLDNVAGRLCVGSLRLGGAILTWDSTTNTIKVESAT